ncbi:hypothetical protein SY88_00370 [Clostridiales bacterium PH28_bin88]|nr:hypothetical protein SY88_00370 [Clostridiales bacterium PH28_bin88]
MNPTVILLILAVVAWFAVFATALALPWRRSFSLSHLRGALDHRLLMVLEQSERSRTWGEKLRRLLAAASFSPGGEPLSMAAFIAASLFFGILLAVPALVILRNPVAAALLGGVGMVLPYQALEVAYSHRKRKLRRQVAPFLLTVGNLYGVYGDPLVALEEAIPRLRDPLRREARWFVTAYKGGLPLPACVEGVKHRLPDAILRRFWDDLRFFIERGGDFQASVTEYVNQVYQREIKATERGADLDSTITVFLVLVGVYVMVLVTMIRTQPELVGFLVVDPRGKMAVSLMAGIFIAAGYFIKMMVTREGDG